MLLPEGDPLVALFTPKGETLFYPPIAHCNQLILHCFPAPSSGETGSDESVTVTMTKGESFLFELAREAVDRGNNGDHDKADTHPQNDHDEGLDGRRQPFDQML